MALKNAQPKIADSLSVFIEQIEKIEKNTAFLQNLSEGLNQKMETFYQYEPTVNFKPLETINAKHIAVLEEMTFIINKTLNNHVKDLENDRIQKDTFFFRFSIMIGLIFIVSVFTSFLSIRYHNQKEKAEILYKESETARKKQKEDFVKFLTDQKLWNKYEKWANK
jgi:hypothetical protein